jgi:hypothetical protein
MKRFLAPFTVGVLLLMGLAACGASPDEDDDAPTPDGGPPSDAGPSPLDPLAGDWSINLVKHEGPSLACDMIVAGAGIEVTCPGLELPRQVGEACMQLRDDEHVLATLDGSTMNGRRESLVQFDGSGCAVMGHTTGAAYPTPPRFLFGAEQEQFVTLTTLLDALGGQWRFHLDDPSAGEELLACSVELAMALPAGVSIVADCVVSEDTVEGCTETVSNRLEAVLNPLDLTGSFGQKLVRSGSCEGTTQLFRYDFSATPSVL